MTPAQIQHEFHGGDGATSARSEAIKIANARIKSVFDAVCRRYKINPKQLLLTDPDALVNMVKSVDLQFNRTGIDAGATSNAARTYLKILETPQ
jgi:hypothetical protein